MHEISIGLNHKPFIIAEMSGNHNKSFERALAIVEAAAMAGVSAIKLQTYTADTMTIDCDMPNFKIEDKNSLWYGWKLYDLYKEAHTPWEWHEPLMKRAKELGVLCFSTPFDLSSVDFLESLNVPAYKIASFENTDTNLLKRVSETGKPIIISTGMASLSDIETMLNTVQKSGKSQVILLKCTSAYPANAADANLRTIPFWRELFGCEVGLSDHTSGIGVAVAGVALGATIIEKHFTLDRSEGGVDSAFSLEPEELGKLVEETNRAWNALGHIQRDRTESEKNSLQFKRSVYFIEDLIEGEVITKEKIRCIRPGYGLQPKYYDALIGRSVKRAVKRGEPVLWDLIGVAID